jgi:hypothetical protein
MICIQFWSIVYEKINSEIIGCFGFTHTIFRRNCRNRYYKYGSWQKSGMAGVILFSATGNSSVRSLFHRTSIFNSP